MYGTTFVDGGVINGVPVNFAKEYDPKYIIAVRIMEFDTTVVLKNRKDVVLRTSAVASHYANEETISLANIIIAPDLKGIPLMSGKNNEKMYELGITAAKAILPEIIYELKERDILK